MRGRGRRQAHRDDRPAAEVIGARGRPARTLFRAAGVTPAFPSGLYGGRRRSVLRLALVHDQQLDGARRRVAVVLVAVDRSTRDVDVFAGLHHARLLAAHREGDLAVEHRLPLVAVVGMVDRCRGGSEIWSCICIRTSRDGSFSSAVVKKRVENAGPVGDVDVWVDAVVTRPPPSTMARASVDVRM